MKKLFLLLALAAGIQGFSQQQGQSGQRFVDKLRFGGNLGLTFGTVTSIEVSPLVGYQATERLMLGVGGTYLYYKDTRYTPDFTNSYYGGRTFGTFNITPQIFAWAEYEFLNGELYNPIDQSFQRQWFDNFFVGGGLRQGPIMITALYNLSYQSQDGFYGSPWVIRVGAFF
ncbi:hypothetical protein HZ996_09480 [Cryomorphaceae bacterium]|nr:hypothetical protein HZ996_09480 [Cryomorphaceae bacterium]